MISKDDAKAMITQEQQKRVGGETKQDLSEAVPSVLKARLPNLLCPTGGWYVHNNGHQLRWLDIVGRSPPICSPPHTTQCTNSFVCVRAISDGFMSQST